MPQYFKHSLDHVQSNTKHHIGHYEILHISEKSYMCARQKSSTYNVQSDSSFYCEVMHEDLLFGGRPGDLSVRVQHGIFPSTYLTTLCLEVSHVWIRKNINFIHFFFTKMHFASPNHHYKI